MSTQHDQELVRLAGRRAPLRDPPIAAALPRAYTMLRANANCYASSSGGGAEAVCADGSVSPSSDCATSISDRFEGTQSPNGVAWTAAQCAQECAMRSACNSLQN